MCVDSTGRCVLATQEVNDNSSAEVLEHLTETLNNYHQNLDIATQQVLTDTQFDTQTQAVTQCEGSMLNGRPFKDAMS